MDLRSDTEDLAQATRWLLVVLVAAGVLAAGVIAATDVPGLVGEKWQVVGAAAAALTVVSLLVGLLVVLRSMEPLAEEEALEAATVTDRLPAEVEVEVEDAEGATAGEDAGVDDDEADRSPTVVDDADAFVLPPPAPGLEARRVHRRAVARFHRARTVVTVTVVLAFVGMVGMAVAAVVDGNNVEERQRTLLEDQLSAQEDGPITEPQAVAVQLTTRGLERIADAMGCTGAQIGARPVQGWAVSGTYRNPTVVLFGPVAQCKDIEIALAPRDGFVYPTFGTPAAGTTTPTTRPVATAGGNQGAGAGNGQAAGGAQANGGQAGTAANGAQGQPETTAAP